MYKFYIKYYTICLVAFILSIIGFSSIFAFIFSLQSHTYNGSEAKLYNSIICLSLSILICSISIFYWNKKTLRTCFCILLSSLLFLIIPIVFIFNRDYNSLYIGLYHKNIKDIFTCIDNYRELPDELSTALKKVGLPEKTIEYRLTGGTGVTNIVQEFDGSGGWVYNPEQGIFGLNVKGMEQYTTNLTSYLEEAQKKTETLDNK